ncbi:hypothetical protein V6Z05_05730 [Leptospira venezuelensis]|uniref:hypothetical protein n=1 Tax=Leptospira venezuelensis TaxID=1958811 RepID=UPI000A3BFCB5|nr:hypothetical protein [Leptospira venezuelensis]
MKPFGKYPEHFRILGILLFSYVVITNYLWREPNNYFWICHVSAFLLSGSLILGFRKGIRIGSFWAILGSLLWLSDELLNNYPLDKLSYFTHSLYTIISIYCFRKIGITPFPWLGAFFWYTFAQILSYIFTDPVHNINLVYSIWPPWDILFSNYLYFWIFMNIFIFCILFFSSLLSDRYSEN